MSQALLPPPAWLFTAEQVANRRRPIVYVYSRGAEVLYVGQSSVGVSRPLSPGHHVLGEMCEDGILRVWTFDDAREAAAVEARLIRVIRELNPKHNAAAGVRPHRGPRRERSKETERACPACGEVFRPYARSRGAHIYCSGRCRTAAWRKRP